jgi:heavy metal translocating P-type ATPase
LRELPQGDSRHRRRESVTSQITSNSEAPTSRLLASDGESPPKAGFGQRKNAWIAALSVAAIVAHLVLRFATHLPPGVYNVPLYFALVFGGLPLVYELLLRVWAREFGSDLLAGMSIVTSVFLEEYLAGTFVVLMLSGGGALENYAVRSASSVLEALARRMPSVAHRRQNRDLVDVALDQVAVNDRLVVLPHEVCPVDGVVTEGHGVMDESYLTGEPFMMSKTPGSTVMSGAINGESALTIQASRLAVDSRYVKIMQVMRASEQRRPRIRRLGDTLGAYYTPLAVAIALLAWAASGQANRFLAVLVVATPCPLLIAIPVAIIGSISLAARRGIIIRDPAVLEQVENCRTVILDKTGTLTFGEPHLVEQHVGRELDRRTVLTYAASLERYSKHPLATAIVAAAQSEGLALVDATAVRERPGEGLHGTIEGREVWITSRKQLSAVDPDAQRQFPPVAGGLECCVAIDGRYAATYGFRDEPRPEGFSFVGHLRPRHRIERVMLVSGDRESEVRYLADEVGIHEVYASQSPEDKVELVRRETARTKTLFLGDGINDAPALTAATVGIAFGQHSDITAEAAGAVIMDTSLARVDEFLHISRRMRTIALQSALGGMGLSIAGMGLAAFGYLSPVAGAITQEVIDLMAVLNALRVALPPPSLTDFQQFSRRSGRPPGKPATAAVKGI